MTVSFDLPSAVPLSQIRFLCYGMGDKMDSGEPIYGAFRVALSLLFREMIMLVRTLLTFLFCLSGAWVWAAEPATPPAGGKVQAPAVGSKAEEFAKVDKEWTDLIANLGALKSEYATATDAAKKAEIRKQYNEGVEKAKALEGKLVEAAESAFSEAPNADSKIAD
ncbi:MAG: hypothetical protein ABSG53_29625, partial [Thermoguttaceae bacterium]